MGVCNEHRSLKMAQILIRSANKMYVGGRHVKYLNFQMSQKSFIHICQHMLCAYVCKAM